MSTCCYYNGPPFVKCEKCRGRQSTTKKSLFDSNEKYTQEAIMLENEVYSALLPILGKYFRYHSAREVEYIVKAATASMALEELLK